MAPIDVNGPSVPPAPIPPADNDDDKDRDRDDRAKKSDAFLRVMRDSVTKEHEKQRAQQNAAMEVSRETTEAVESAMTKGDRDRDASRRDGEPLVDVGSRADDDSPRSSSRALPRNSTSQSKPQVGRSTPFHGDNAAVRPSNEAQSVEKSESRTPRVKDGERISESDADPPSDPAKLAPSRVAEADAFAGNPSTGLPGSPGLKGEREKQDGAPLVPNSVVRQAVEFAQFSERGGLLEFSLGLAGNVLGGALLTIQSLGHKKIAIKLVNGRGGKALSPSDLNELVERMRERGIDVTTVEVTP